MAMGAMDALRFRLGIRIPEDVMVAGFDDIIEAERSPYRLTTVRQPLEGMIEATLAMLQLDHPGRPVERELDQPLPGQLIWRDTVPVPVELRDRIGRAEADE